MEKLMKKPTKEEWIQWHEEKHMQAKTLIKMVQQLKQQLMEIASQYATNEELKGDE